MPLQEHCRDRYQARRCDLYPLRRGNESNFVSGRSPRQKGDRLERAVVNQLQAAGLAAKRVPLSGSVQGYPGDVSVTLAGRELCVEVKSRKDFKTLYGWLENRDALILKADRKDPLLVLRLDDVLELIEGSHA